QHLGRCLDQLCTAAYQLVTAARERIADRAGDGEHLPTLPGCESSGLERAAGERGLDHQGTRRQAADQAIAAREVLAARRGARRKLGNQCSALTDSIRQTCVLPWIDLVETRRADRYRAATRCECALVTRSVDSNSHAARDHGPGA